MNAALFNWHLQLRKFTLQSLLLKIWSTNKFHHINQLNFAGNTLFYTFRTESQEILKHFHPVPVISSGPPLRYPMFRTERTKTLPVYIGHIREYPPLPPDQNVRQSGLYSELKATQSSRTQCLHMKHF